MMKNRISLKIANTIAFAAMVTVNILANALPLGGLNTGQISAMYPTILTPPGFTFAIWGVIYALLGLFIASQFLFVDAAESDRTAGRIGPWFILSCVCNILWIFCWHNRWMVPAFAAIAGLFACLMRIYRETRQGNLLTRTSFGIYYAWITVAGIMSVFILIKTLTGHAPVTPIQARDAIGALSAAPAGSYTDIVLVAGDPEIVSYVSKLEYIMSIAAIVFLTLLTAGIYMAYADLSFVFTVVWAVGGILYRQITAPVPPVLMLVVAVLGLLFIGLFVIRQTLDQRACRRFMKKPVG